MTHNFVSLSLIFIGGTGSEFRAYSKFDLNLVETKFRKFDFIVLWSFLGFPSDKTGNFMSYKTVRNEELLDIMDDTVRSFLTDFKRGFNEEESVGVFYHSRQYLADVYFNTIARDLLKTGYTVPQFVKKIGGAFYKEGYYGSRGHIDHVRRCRFTYGESSFTKIFE